MPDLSRALFIPLRREHFEAFMSGEKTTEYRKTGGPWNAQTCCIGRSVTLSLGYGKGQRARGTIVGFKVQPTASLSEHAQRAIAAIYGEIKEVACIEIKLKQGDACDAA